MPGAVAKTSTYALTNATLPYILLLAENGYEAGIRKYFPINRAANMITGDLVIQEVADTFGMPFRDLKDI
jgi:alanine dehydrogenase